MNRRRIQFGVALALVLGLLALVSSRISAASSTALNAAPAPVLSLSTGQWTAVQESNSLLTSRGGLPLIFADGFETGNVSRWSSSQ